jgi:WD40 repeat protein
MPEGPRTLDDKLGVVEFLAFAPDGNTLASAEFGGPVALWDVATRKQLAVLDPKDLEAKLLAFSPDGERLTAVYSHGVMAWHVATREEIPTSRLPVSEPTVSSAGISADGLRLALGRSNGTLTLWDVEPNKVLDIPQAHKGVILATACSPDGKVVSTGATAPMDNSPQWLTAVVKLWDGESGKPMATLPAHYASVPGLRFTPDGEELISVGMRTGPGGFERGADRSDWCLRFWRVVSGPQDPAFTSTHHTSTVRQLLVSQNGETLVTGSLDSTVKVWDVRSRKLRTTFKGPGAVEGVALSPDGKTLAVAFVDRKIKLYPVPPPK